MKDGLTSEQLAAIDARQQRNAEQLAQHRAKVGRNIHHGFTFDGFGINGRDAFRSRLATLTDAGHAEQTGPLLAASFELLGACRWLLENGDFSEMSAESTAAHAAAWELVNRL